jgi:hypothetical protein
MSSIICPYGHITQPWYLSCRNLGDFLRKDGSVMRAGEFDHGKQVGICRTFDRSVRVVKATDFSRGR